MIESLRGRKDTLISKNNRMWPEKNAWSIFCWEVPLSIKTVGYRYKKCAIRNGFWKKRKKRFFRPDKRLTGILLNSWTLGVSYATFFYTAEDTIRCGLHHYMIKYRDLFKPTTNPSSWLVEERFTNFLLAKEISASTIDLWSSSFTQPDWDRATIFNCGIVLPQLQHTPKDRLSRMKPCWEREANTDQIDESFQEHSRALAITNRNVQMS